MQERKSGLLHGFDIDALRDKIRTPPFDAVYRDMRETVRRTAEEDAKRETLPSGGWCHSRYFTPAVLQAGFVCAMEDAPFAVEHIVRQIDRLARVYADPPESFYRELGDFKGKPSAYFSNAHTCMAVRMCEDALPAESLEQLKTLARTRLIDDCHDPQYFMTHFNAAHNAVTTHVVSAAICALCYGEETGHPLTEQLLEQGRDACDAHITWGYDEQGVPHEGPMYSLVTLEWVFLYADLMKRHGMADLFASLPRLERIAQAYHEMQFPGDAGIPAFDDCRTLVVQHHMPWLLLTEREYGRPHDRNLWRSTAARAISPRQDIRRPTGAPPRLGIHEILWWDGREPDPADRPDLPTAFVGEGKAVAVFRDSWKEDATCLVVLGQGRSHNIPDHTHADAGHFSIHTRGELLAYDTAYFNFDEDRHNVVLIDGAPHYPTTQGNQYAGRFRARGRDPLLDWVQVDAAGAKGCMWADRTVLYIRGRTPDANGCVVVLDNINRDNGVHRFAWQLHADAHCSVSVDDERTARVEGEVACIDCRFFSPLPEDFPSSSHSLDVRAETAEHTDILSGEPDIHPRLVAEQTGPNCTLASVLVPRLKTEPPKTIRDESAYRTFQFFVEHDDCTDQIVYACDHTLVRLPTLRANSEIVVVRRDRDGTLLGSWTIDGRPVDARPAAP